jgi:hypothetical protein
MTRAKPYFMQDQIRHRVALIMGGQDQPKILASPLWPLIAVIAALTFLNVAAAIPAL